MAKIVGIGGSIRFNIFKVFSAQKQKVTFKDAANSWEQVKKIIFWNIKMFLRHKIHAQAYAIRKTSGSEGYDLACATKLSYQQHKVYVQGCY